MKNKLEFKDSLRKKEKLERKAPDMQISYRLGSRNPLSSPGLGPCSIPRILLISPMTAKSVGASWAVRNSAEYPVQGQKIHLYPVWGLLGYKPRCTVSEPHGKKQGHGSLHLRCC